MNYFQNMALRDEKPSVRDKLLCERDKPTFENDKLPTERDQPNNTNKKDVSAIEDIYFLLNQLIINRR